MTGSDVADLERKLAAVTEDRDRLRSWMNNRNETIRNQRRALRDLQKALLVERGQRHDSRLSDLVRRVDALEKVSHEPYDFTDLVGRIEDLEGIVQP